MNTAANHHINCGWHLDQYNWECTCGAIEKPEERRPDFKALISAMEDAEDSLTLAEHRLQEAMGTLPTPLPIEEADKLISEGRISAAQLAHEAREIYREIIRAARFPGPTANTVVVPWLPMRHALKDRLDRLCEALGVENAGS